MTSARVLTDRFADDVDGDQPTDAVALSYRGVDYQIDLTENDATGLHQVRSSVEARDLAVSATGSWSPDRRRPLMTSTILLPFQPDAMTPAPFTAVSYWARYTGRTNALDPLVGIQRAHVGLYIRHLGDGGLRVSSVSTMTRVAR